MAMMKYGAALVGAIRGCMERDTAVNLVAGSIGGPGGASIMQGIVKDFADRIVDPPISEGALAGICTGAAMSGLRPILPFGTASFMQRGWDQIIHEAGICHYMSNGKVRTPVVFHALHGLRGGGAPQHSLSPQAMFWNNPGLEIVMPSTPADVSGLFRAAVESDNPTVFLDHAKLMGTEGEVPDGGPAIPLGVADIKRAGDDVTIVAISLQVLRALEAAETLAGEGISAEVVDLRTLVPLDRDAIFASLDKTGRLVIVDEGPPHCSVAAEIAAIVAEDGFDKLRAPIARVTRLQAPAAASPTLEDALGPTPERIADAARGILEYKPAG